MPQQLGDLIFDRTQSDVSHVQSLTRKMIAGTATDAEKEEWLGGEMKGAYNAADLNRVGSAVEYLTDTLYSMGYNVPTVPKDNWTETNIPVQSQMDIYINNIQLLRDILPYVAPDAPDAPENLTFVQANAIEEILYRLEQVLIAMQKHFKFRQANTFFMTAGGVFNNA